MALRTLLLAGAVALGASKIRGAGFIGSLSAEEEEWCKTHDALPSGGFCPNSLYVGIDARLVQILSSFFQRHGGAGSPRTIGDFGAGGGWYSTHFNKQPGLRSSPFDFSPKPGSGVERLDLSRPAPPDIGVFDWVLCLEVGEHIPREREATFLDNLANHARHGIVLSWAVPGQSGNGHINLRDNAYVVGQMALRGWETKPAVARNLRDRSTHPWFKNTIMVFKRKAKDPERMPKDLGGRLSYDAFLALPDAERRARYEAFLARTSGAM
mmetsp:Transcript_2984/g.8726  ORF Transcript_2984/g.8726 Transcript_2984/m.8726 type:complete len:268 (-) Transcript_2984:208-1011(-)